MPHILLSVSCNDWHYSFQNTYGNIAHGSTFLIVGVDNHVDIFYNALTGLVKVFFFQLQGEQSKVHLVHEKYWSDALTNGLAKNSLCLHTNTCEANRMFNLVIPANG